MVPPRMDTFKVQGFSYSSQHRSNLLTACGNRCTMPKVSLWQSSRSPR